MCDATGLSPSKSRLFKATIFLIAINDESRRSDKSIVQL